MTTTTETGTVPEFTIADRLRKARESRGLDQRALAKNIGVSRGTISNYELGTYPPKRPVLLSWAMATGVPLSWLITGATPAESPDGDSVTVTYPDLLRAVA